MNEIIELLALFAGSFALSQTRAIRSPMFRLMERFSVALPFGGRMHAPIPEQDMRERYELR